jgi:methyltransferase (TIGR00027 family)
MGARSKLRLAGSAIRFTQFPRKSQTISGQSASCKLQFMQPGRASKTALRVAQRRAIHQVLDQPPVLNDSIAVPLLGNHFTFDRSRESKPIARAFRAYMAARSRFAEDQLAFAVSSGVAQYVLLGAGLDTFAYRNPHPHLRVFEVDFPATQDWKRTLLVDANIAVPPDLIYVPHDFECKTLAESLVNAGFDRTLPAFFAWLGVVPYLSLEAFRATIATIAQYSTGTCVCFDYAVSPAKLGFLQRKALDALAARVAAAGEPFRLFFAREDLEQELLAAGFHQIQQRTPDELNALYFANREDNLKLPSPGLGMFATTWV